MSNPSNLYAEKIFSEHPTALWALDDQADYVSLLTEEQREISETWTISNATLSNSSEYISQPFKDSFLTKVVCDIPSGPTSTVTFISDDIVNFANLDQDYSTFAVGAYFYFDTQFVKNFSIGYEYTDTTTAEIVQNLITSTVAPIGKWLLMSQTFDIPNENTNLRLVIKIEVDSGGGAEDYDLYINGVTLGQWSEEFNAKSLGVDLIPVPSNISSITSTLCIEAERYGIYGPGEDSGYYLAKENTLLAKNSGVPMVYGSSNITRLKPNTTGQPSLIFPGKGFLNKDGQFKQYTVEFWAKISSSTYEPRKIFGPIVGTDGLYAESGFLTLVIGNKFASHFVGEWFRPMLIDICLIENLATVLVNGEQVISLNINTKDLNLPELYDEYGDSQDWLGFYCYEDVPLIELDCVAIYSYKVPDIVAKRRWVYGQGVQSQDSINSSYGGTSAVIDYPFADYTANYSYPDFAQWQQGTFDNLNTTSNALTTPQYSLPNIFLSDKTIQELYDDNLDIQGTGDKFLTFNPNLNWENTKCYINFNSLNILNTDIEAIYGVFDTDNLTDICTLFKIYNEATSDYFIIEKNLEEIKYSLFFEGEEQELSVVGNIVEDEKFAVGILVDRLVQYFGGNVSSFFGNRANLKMYVCGDETGTKQFNGKIYSIGLSTLFNANEISEKFEDDGTVIFDSHLATGSEESENANNLIAHTASYTLLPLVAYNTFFLDIGVSGYWEDYMPLSYFAQFVKNDIGNDFYHLDFLQFNIGYPSESSLVEQESTTETWSYEDLYNEYTHPTQRTYNNLDNALFTNWSNYEDMQQKSIKYYEFNTDNALIKSYITMQYIEEGANAPKDAFLYTENIPADSIIDLENYQSTWQVTKFSVMNNTLIYPSRYIDFNDLAIVYHLEFKVRGILTKPIALRRLELSSQAFSHNSFNPVGTRFGNNLFPYTRSGIYYDYKARNPFSIYKGSTPYLYMTRDSGIELRGSYDPSVNRGISMPINSTLANDYRVSAMQLWMRYDKDDFPVSPSELFEVSYKGDIIKFYMVANSQKGDRARIYATSVATGKEFTGLSYYWNGSLVREPVMTTKEWGVLGVAFSSALNFDSFIGAINMTGYVVFNNISYYQANNLQQVQSTVPRSWLRVISDGITTYDWDYWENFYTWSGVLVISSSDLYGTNPDDVYKTYMGTNKIIIDDNDGFDISEDSFKIYNETEWSISSGSAV